MWLALLHLMLGKGYLDIHIKSIFSHVKWMIKLIGITVEVSKWGTEWTFFSSSRARDCRFSTASVSGRALPLKLRICARVSCDEKFSKLWFNCEYYQFKWWLTWCARSISVRRISASRSCKLSASNMLFGATPAATAAAADWWWCIDSYGMLWLPLWRLQMPRQKCGYQTGLKYKYLQ